MCKRVISGWTEKKSCKKQNKKAIKEKSKNWYKSLSKEQKDKIK